MKSFNFSACLKYLQIIRVHDDGHCSLDCSCVELSVSLNLFMLNHKKLTFGTDVTNDTVSVLQRARLLLNPQVLC